MSKVALVTGGQQGIGLGVIPSTMLLILTVYRTFWMKLKRNWDR